MNNKIDGCGAAAVESSTAIGLRTRGVKSSLFPKVLIATVSTALLVWKCPAAADPAPKSPNVIVIMADDLGWGDLSCQPQDPKLPDALVRTPNIDRIAAEGIRFTNAYATASVCAPSRAGFLTGRNQQRFGFYGFEEAQTGIPHHLPLLPEVMKQRGYATALVGKWHVGFAADNRPLQRGFDRFFGFLGGQHDYFKPNIGEPAIGFGFDYDGYIYDQNTPITKMGYATDEFTDRSLAWIEEQTRAKKPFFLYLAYSTPHPPMQATWDLLQPFSAQHKGHFTQRDIARAMIVSLDQNVARLTAALEKLGIARDTLIIFTSDNGGQDDREWGSIVQYNGGLRPRKGFFWEGGIRIPFLMRWPGHIPAGKTFEEPVSHFDIYATAATLAGAPAAKGLDGVDLLPYLLGSKGGAPHETLCWGGQGRDSTWAVRHGKWKLTHDQEHPGKNVAAVTELHDVVADPEERKDLAADHPDVVAELTRLKNAFYNQCVPSLLTPQARAEWQSDLKRRHAVLPNPDVLRKDGAPGHGF